MAKIYTHKCLTCGQKFGSLESAQTHVNKRHANGAVWVEGNKSLWDERSTDGRYMLVCNTHSQAINFTSKAIALDWTRTVDTREFCECCANPDEWCDGCETHVGTWQMEFHKCLGTTSVLVGA